MCVCVCCGGEGRGKHCTGLICVATGSSYSSGALKQQLLIFLYLDNVLLLFSYKLPLKNYNYYYFYYNHYFYYFYYFYFYYYYYDLLLLLLFLFNAIINLNHFRLRESSFKWKVRPRQLELLVTRHDEW